MSGADYLPPDQMTLDAAGDALAARLDVRVHAPATADRTYLDTFDALLRAEGLSAVYERGRLELVDRGTGAVHAGLEAPVPTGPVLAVDLDDCALREALLAIVDVRALLPLVHVHSRTRALDVLDGERKTVVRMTLEEPAVTGSGGQDVALRPRVRVAAVRGYDRELEAVREQLEHELRFTPADQPLVDEAVRATGGVPAGISSKIDVTLTGDQRADAAAVAVLRALLAVIEANIEGAIADIDSEFLHDLRVAVRRSRAVQRELKRVFPPEPLRAFRNEFKWLQQATGDSRDLDVYVLEFGAMRALVPESMRADLEPLRAVLLERRAAARLAMARALRSRRCSRLLADWGAFLEELVGLGTDDRPDAALPVLTVAGARIAKVYARMVKMGRAIDADSPAEDYHELRKKGKELRYLLELFGTRLFDSEVVKPMIRSLKGLQDVLGRHQDREVQIAMLRSLRDEVAASPAGAGALMAMGVLVDRLGRDEIAARRDFAEAFDRFASKQERRTVKETFA